MNVLTVDAGSTSLKYALYDVQRKDERCFFEETLETGAGSAQLVQAVRARGFVPDVIAHRVVFGALYTAPQLITPALLDELSTYEAIAPLHLPAQLRLIRDLAAAFAGSTQVACFDTSFHRRMPALAQTLPIPRDIDPVLQRYGYHGLSCEYACSVVDWRRYRRVLIAHLGGGASITAVRDGVPLETSMGFSPCSGLVMGTRTGDVDPEMILYLLNERGLTPNEVRDLCTRKGGLLGVSGRTGDMRALLEAASSDRACAQAVDLFVYTAAKFAGALTVALGGLDLIVFTGGIGENARVIRESICSRLQFLVPFDALTVHARETLILARSARLVNLAATPCDETAARV